MSLEVSVDRLNSNIERLIELLARGPIAAPATEPAKPAKKTEPAPKVEAAPPSAPAPEAPAPSTPAGPSVEDVTKATLALVKAKGRDAAVAVLREFSVEKATQLKPEQFATYIAATQKAAA